ncbi:MAG: restriction endonuclease subunit S [Gammaproteobacteria bacterium]|nr:restriction endonuclease subunit S [Gammaproteobacteria bacterium]
MIADLKPYGDYKDSGSPWLEAAPFHWDVRNLRTLIRPCNERNRTDLPLLSVAREKGVFVRSLTDADENHNVIPEDLSNYKVARAGCLVINKMKAWQGSMGIAPVDGIVSPAYFVYDFAITNRMFGQMLLRSRPYVAHFAQASDGVRVGQWDLTISSMREIPVLLPPPDEQAAIVRFLDWANGRLERAIRAKRKVIALLNEQKQAIIHRAVTRGLDPDVPLKPSGIPWLGDIPQHWEVMPLKGVCAIQSGITLGKDYTGQTLREYPYLRVANVQAGHVNLSVVKTIRVTKTEADRCLLQRGDVLMTEGGDLDKLGRGCVWNAQMSPCLHQNHVFAVRPNQSRLEPRFLSALMGTSYARAYFQSTAKQTTNLAATNKTKLGMFKVLLPGVDEQHQIIATLDEELQPVNLTTDRLNREIALLREYRTRLVADVVTGKLDVRAAAARLPVETDAPEPLDEADLDELADATADGEVEA